MKRGAAKPGQPGEVIPFEMDWDRVAGKTRLLEIVEELTEKVRLAEADIIVAGGRGLQEGKNFALIRELADSLGGAVGASRGAVDSGWIPYAHQVGQTGKDRSPQIISGHRRFRGGPAFGGDAVLRNHCGREQ